MYERVLQSVLRCGRCNKVFDKQSTLKRHEYYCRSRGAASTTRARSCFACARRKARCDNRRPECSGCINKAIECHYPAKSLKGTGPRIHQSVDGPAQQWEATPLLVPDSSNVENHQEARNDGAIDLNAAFDIPELDFTNVGGEYLEWDVPNIDFPNFLNQQTNDETARYPSSMSSSSFRYSTPSTEQMVQAQLAISSPIVSIPPVPTYFVRSLGQRPRTKTGAQRIVTLMRHTLKSYPSMMLRHDALPPFIHPHLISSNAENDHMEPLNNCISLVHMISSGVKGSRKLFWKNVGLECERFCEEYLKFNKWELIAAMLALSIYILIRLDEGETDHNNFDFLLLRTVTITAKQLSDIHIVYDIQSMLNNCGLEISWKDWIFEESRRRLCVVYRVLNMLVYFEPAAMCNLRPDLVIAPLPAKKQLWEANDEYVWKAESEREPGFSTAFGLAATGGLVEVDEGRIHCSDAVLHKSWDERIPPSKAVDWERWCSGMDEFGGLVMLAASLIV